MSLVTSTPTNNLFYARPHLYPLPRGEDFGNHGLGGLIDCPANPGARIFKGMADDSPSPWGEGRVEGGRGSKLTNLKSHFYWNGSAKSFFTRSQSLCFGNFCIASFHVEYALTWSP